MSNDTQVKQEDKGPERFWLIPSEWGLLPSKTLPTKSASIEYVRVDLLTTVRREEREAAFKVLCAECAEGSAPTFDQDARWYYHGLGHTEVGCSASKLRIAALEASASEKGEMNE